MEYQRRGPSEREEYLKDHSENSGNDKRGLGSKLKNWVSSASAGWVFYTPLMAPIEYFVADMDPIEVVKSRAINMAFGHSIGLPLYQKSKETMYRAFNVRKDSSFLKKKVVDALAFVPVHPPTYAAFLTLAGASFEEITAAVPAGLAVVMGTSPVFSPFMEFWRTKVLNQESTYVEESLQRINDEVKGERNGN